jgi:hypothetical protein
MLTSTNQIQCVTSAEALLQTPFTDTINAICYQRKLVGDFTEIIQAIVSDEDIIEVDAELLDSLSLSHQGQLARQILIDDLLLLTAYGAAPSLNIITQYDRDEGFFPTDVYSFHVDKAPIPTATFLCTYTGAASEIVPSAQAAQKILLPEIRNELQKLHDGPANEFDNFLSDNFFDLHYQALPNAQIINCGMGNLWKLAVDCKDSGILPCIHRAPLEGNGEKRLLLIC